MKKQAEVVIERKRISVDIQESMHADMRELAKRKRVHIGVIYDEAIRLYLQRTENYLGSKKSNSERITQNGYR